MSYTVFNNKVFIEKNRVHFFISRRSINLGSYFINTILSEIKKPVFYVIHNSFKEFSCKIFGVKNNVSFKKTENQWTDRISDAFFLDFLHKEKIEFKLLSTLSWHTGPHYKIKDIENDVILAKKRGIEIFVVHDVKDVSKEFPDDSTNAINLMTNLCEISEKHQVTILTTIHFPNLNDHFSPYPAFLNYKKIIKWTISEEWFERSDNLSVDLSSHIGNTQGSKKMFFKLKRNFGKVLIK